MDERTVIVVADGIATVEGTGKVFLYNPREWTKSKKPYYRILGAGDRFDMETRRPLPSILEQ